MKEHDILAKLNVLNQQELTKVFKLINKLAAKHPQQEKPVEPEPIPQKLVSRRKPDLHKIKGPVNRVSPNEPLAARRSGAKIGRGKGTKEARSEPIFIPSGERENKFFQLTIGKENTKIADTHKEDTEEFDRKIVASVSPRKGCNLAEMECIECGDIYEINPDLVASEEGFTCNDCIVRKKRF